MNWVLFNVMYYNICINFNILVYFSFNNIKVIKDILSKDDDKKLKLNFREDVALQFQHFIEPLLLSCLGDRISEMCFHISQEPANIGMTQEPFNNFLIGLRLNSQRANSVVERGPTANLPEVIFNEICF